MDTGSLFSRFILRVCGVFWVGLGVVFVLFRGSGLDVEIRYLVVVVVCDFR